MWGKGEWWSGVTGGRSRTTLFASIFFFLFSSSKNLGVSYGLVYHIVQKIQYLIVDLICISLKISDVEHHYICWLAICFFREMSVWVICLFLNFIGICCLGLGVLYMFWILIFIRIWFELSSPILWITLWYTNFFNFPVIQFVYSFVACAFGVLSNKSLSNPMSLSFGPMV